MKTVLCINRGLKKGSLLAILGFISLSCFSQLTKEQELKLSPLLKEKISDPSREKKLFTVFVSEKAFFKSTLGGLDAKIIYEYDAANIFVIKTSLDEIIKKLINLPSVLFIDEQRIPKEELAVSNLDISTNKANVVHSKFPQWNGNGVVVSVKENRPDTSDIDFKGRYLSTTLSSSSFSTHASTMMTIIGGGGNTFYEGKGVAWGSTLSSSSFAVLLPDNDAAYQQYNITVQNHSYGTGIENFYGADAAAYDASVIARPALVHVFSAGNSGTQTGNSGSYANVAAYANITGSFKMAKNIITVGHVDSSGNILLPSSKGPAYDGRLKPELVAFGEDGSSGAAAIVSGIALTLQQAYKDIYGAVPPASLVKAVLINSADDAGPKGIDFSSGYGLANAYKAMNCIAGSKFFSGNINNGGNDVFNLAVPANLRQLKISLVWTDPPSSPNATKALKNDLDLQLSLPSSGQSWLPWVLNTSPNVDSLQLLPLRKKDSLNVAEQITIDNPVAGNYVIGVKGFFVSQGAQQYHIAYQFDTANQFTWYYPTGNDNLFGDRTNFLRWESGYGNVAGSLKYSLNNGATWQLIDNAVDLSKGFYKWSPPDSFVTAMLRMDIGSQNYASDTFTISRRFNVNVGFNCNDSFHLFWSRIPGVNLYKLYQLGNKYMEPFATADTSIILGKQSHPSLYYAVAPVLGNKTGVRSYGYNYTTQGVQCYFRSFIVELINNAGKLDIELGTNYNVKTITWEKLLPSGYISLQTTNSINGIQFTYVDTALMQGLNTYRAKIELLNGQVIYSDPETFYFANDPYIIYPNPVARGQVVKIINNDTDIKIVQVFNSLGLKVYETKLTDWINLMPTLKLGKGIYLVRIFKDKLNQSTLKLVVF